MHIPCVYLDVCYEVKQLRCLVIYWSLSHRNKIGPLKRSALFHVHIVTNCVGLPGVTLGHWQSEKQKERKVAAVESG